MKIYPSMPCLAHLYSGAWLKELAECFGLSESGVFQARRRFAAVMDKDGVVKIEVEAIIEKLQKSWV